MQLNISADKSQQVSVMYVKDLKQYIHSIVKNLNSHRKLQYDNFHGNLWLLLAANKGGKHMDRLQYINQLCTPSFPIGLVKTKSYYIVRSAESGLGRWMLVAAVISVEAYHFLAFSDQTCHLEDTGIGVF